MKKSYQQYINDYAERAIENGMDPNQAWASAANQADRALLKGWIVGNEAEMTAANDRAEAFGLEKLDIGKLGDEPREAPPISMDAMRSQAAKTALGGGTEKQQPAGGILAISLSEDEKPEYAKKKKKKKKKAEDLDSSVLVIQ
jgi:hypothetical protein|tara:strand:- start:370 stop:798 length:429 start_codon:yes stop_codon:yes gene_type:complete